MKTFSKMAVILILTLCVYPAQSQNLKKFGLKKASEALRKNILGEEEAEKKEPDNGEDTQGKKVKTLDTRMSASEVQATMDRARMAYNDNKLGSARSAVQDALAEIELTLGENVLEEMPKDVTGISYEPSEDIVISTGSGFMGLEIVRKYPGSDGEVTAALMNNSAMLAPYNVALSSSSTASSQDNMKKVTVNGKPAILELDDDGTSYRLAVPFGENSIFILDCEPCENESSVINAGEKFDLDLYLKILGETEIVVDLKN